MIKLNKDNYYGVENTAISSSKVRDFLRSKELYYHRYIEGKGKSDESNSITLGRIVDKILEQGTMYHFYRTYVTAVKKKDDAELFAKQKKMDDRRILTPAMYDQAVSIATKALRSPFFEWYKSKKVKSEKQKILVADYQLAVDSRTLSVPICGMLDRVSFDGNTAYIDDYKTSAFGSMKSAKSWVYNCYSSGYFIQMAVYRWLVQQIYPEYEQYVCRHIVLGTSKADLYPIKLYIIPDQYIDEGRDIFFDTVYQISTETDWVDPLPGWDMAETLPDINEEGDSNDIDEINVNPILGDLNEM